LIKIGNIIMKKTILFTLAVCCTVGLGAQQLKTPKYGKKLTSHQVVGYLASDQFAGCNWFTLGDTLRSDFIYCQSEIIGM